MSLLVPHNEDAMPQRDRHGPASERGSAIQWVVMLIVGLVVTAAVTVYFVDRTGPAEEAEPPVPPDLVEPAPPGPGLAFPDAGTPPKVLDPLAPSVPISARTLRTRLEPVVSSAKLGNHLGFAVAGLGDAGLLWRVGGPGGVTPASTMKLLTCVTVLEILGPEHRFDTSVVDGRGADQIVLIGGGDPLLTDERLTPEEAAATYPPPATLQSLANKTASALKAAGRRHVSLAYDDSLFAGPALNPTWEPSYLQDSVVSPISALWVDEGRSVKGLTERVVDPGAEAARRFATLLAAKGLRVQGRTTPGRAAAAAHEVATVSSPPLAQIVQHVLELSDNEGAEVLLRQAALGAGRPGTFDAGARTVERTLAELGVDLAGSRIFDGSGLSRRDLVPIETLVAVLQVAAGPDHPELRAVVSSLPVAGFTGSLAYRFVSDAPAGLGVVRAKTGTLTGVHGLAGVVVTRQGQGLVFAAVADEVPVRKTLDARAQLDRIAATLATCGC